MAKGLLMAPTLHWSVIVGMTERRLAEVHRELVYVWAALVVQEVHDLELSYLVPKWMKGLRRMALETETHWIVPHEM